MATGKVSDLGKNLVKSVQTIVYGPVGGQNVNVPIAAVDTNKALITRATPINGSFGNFRARLTSATNVWCEFGDSSNRTLILEITEYR